MATDLWQRRNTTLPQDIDTGAKVKRSKRTTQGSAYKPQATSILQGQLRTIARYGTPADLARAKEVAKGGGEPLWRQGLKGAQFVVGFPQRFVETVLSGALMSRMPDTMSYWDKLTSPEYGMAHEIDRMTGGKVNPWAKIGTGLAVDIALDPLTYMSFGASAALKAAGRGKGLANIAFDAADKADEVEEAARLLDVGNRAAKGAFNLGNDELREIELLAMYPEGSFSHGIHFSLPGSSGNKYMSATGGVAGRVGRGLERTGAKVTARASESALGHYLGGNLNEVKTWLNADDAGKVRRGARIITGTGRAKNAETYALRKMAAESAPLEARARKLGITTEEIDDALRSRPLALREPAEELVDTAGEAVEAAAPTGKLSDRPLVRTAEGKRIFPTEEGGPAWQELAGRSPEHEAVLSDWADMIAKRREFAHETAAHGDVRLDFIGDAEEGGRPYVQRVPTEAYAKRFGAAARSSNMPTRKAFLEEGAIAPGTKAGAKFKQEYGVDLYTPGAKSEIFPEGAPSIEDQVEAAYRLKHGDDFEPWYDRDFYKTNQIYERALAKAIGKYKLSNYLVAKGIARELPKGPLGKALADLTAEPRWRADLFRGWENGKMISIAGKEVDNPAYLALQRELDKADEALDSISSQFDMAVDDAGEANDLMISAELEVMRTKSGRVSRAKANAEKVEAYRQAKALFEQRQQVEDTALQQVLHVEGKAEMLRGAMADWRTGDWEKILADHDAVGRAFHRALNAGAEGFGFARQAPPDVIEALKDINKAYDPITGEGLAGFVEQYDSFLHWMKGWQTASPGFTMRNTMGGMFNNWLAGVNVLRSGKGWLSILNRSQPFKGSTNLAKLEPGERALFQIADQFGIIGQGQFSTELGRELGEVSWVNPLAGLRKGSDKSFALPYGVKRANEQFVEPMLRGTMFYDRMMKYADYGRFEALGVPGGQGAEAFAKMTDDQVEGFVRGVVDSPVMDDITADIHKYHFNYDDLSRTERQVVRRVIPFYTWTRKNVPLQVEAMFTQPGKAIGRYMAIKRNLESASTEGDFTPSWMEAQGFIRLPFEINSNRAYTTVDLPFKDPFEAMDVSGQLLGMVNPMIKTPLEVWADKKFFNQVPVTPTYKPMPGVWQRIPGLIPALHAIDAMPFVPLSKPEQGRDGEWMMRDEDIYKLGQMLPFAAQVQRLFPWWDNEDEGKPSKEQARIMTTVLSWSMGIASRTVTPQDMESEVYRRIDAMDQPTQDIRTLQGPERKPRRQRRVSLDAVLRTVGSGRGSPGEDEEAAYEG